MVMLKHIFCLVCLIIPVQGMPYQVFFANDQWEVILDSGDYNTGDPGVFLPLNKNVSFRLVLMNMTTGAVTSSCENDMTFNTLTLSKSINKNVGSNVTYDDVFKNVLTGPMLYFPVADVWKTTRGQWCLNRLGSFKACIAAVYSSGSSSTTNRLQATCQVTRVPPTNLSCDAVLSGGNIEVNTEDNQLLWTGTSAISVSCNARATVKIELTNGVSAGGHDGIRLMDPVTGSETVAVVEVAGQRVTNILPATANVYNGQTELPVQVSGEQLSAGVYSGNLILSLTYI
ncbi:hypothetical protein RKI04_24765 [Citrobacter amalonaticus]|uniref:hypothetical protein n=1 Tax=Citrobacter amalonaticus TaxID=35703 RepID=UPI00287A6267|nr:hypothetical protein [Citrobacter amalonaticus]MDS4039444.1 hypothetical protein [Citrobacter amalonaticus]